MREAELPDGTVLEFPDNTPDAVIQATVKKHLGVDSSDAAKAGRAMPQPKQGLWDRATDMVGNAASNVNDAVQNLGTGVVKGASGTLGLPRVANMTLPGFGLSNPANAGVPYPSGQDIERYMFDKVGIPEYQPKTPAGRVTQHVGEIAGSAPVPGAGPITVASGVTGGVAGEIWRGTPYEKYAQAAGDVLGGGVMGLKQMLRSTPGQMIARRTENMKPQDWADAIARQDRAKGLGVDLLGPEAMDNPSMHRLAADTSASAGGGPKMESFLTNRPVQVEQAVRSKLFDMGPERVPEDVARRVEGAANKAIKTAEGARSKAAKPFYDAANRQQVPAGEIQGVINNIDGVLAPGSGGPAQGTAAFKSLQDLKASLTRAGQPETTVGTLDSLRKSWRDKVTLPEFSAEALSKEAAAKVNPVIDKLRTILETNSSDYRAGRDAYKAASPRVEELAQGDVGRLANPNPAEMANVGGRLQNQIKVITNPDTARPNTIRSVAKELRATDPEAFRDVSRLYIENAFDHASKDIQSGANRMTATNFRNSIAGTPQQRANLNAVLEETAKSNGQDPNRVRNGFNVMLETFERMGKVPGIGSPTAGRSEAFREASQGGAVSTTLDMTRVTDPLHVARRWWQDTTQRKNFAELGRVFTDPNSVRIMQEMAATRPNSARARTLLVEMMNGARISEDYADQPGGE